MKYVVILGDGMADEPIEALNNKTPLQVAKKPTIDGLAQKGEVAMCSTIPEGMSPGSDTANLSVMGYDPRKYYTGRSPLEAVSMGIKMQATDVCFRCNLVTVSEDPLYENKTMIDHSASEISSKEAHELMAVVRQAFSDQIRSFYPGISYRHALIWDHGSTQVTLTPPHNILGQKVTEYMPQGDGAAWLTDIQKRSYDLLKDHPINQARVQKGLNPANSVWIWGEGTTPVLDSFYEKFGMRGAMISAVDLLKGIAIAAGMTSIDVPGADGSLHTNYAGKAQACLDALANGHDFVYVHIEAPDECGHRGEVDNKVLSIEYLDQKIVKPIYEGLTGTGEDFRLLIMPDHPTPIKYRTHTSNPSPYLIYDSRVTKNEGLTYDEVAGDKNGVRFPIGHELMSYFLEKTSSSI